MTPFVAVLGLVAEAFEADFHDVVRVILDEPADVQVVLHAMTVAVFDVFEQCDESYLDWAMGIMEYVRSSELPSERVAADLRRRVQSGEWAPGDQIPSVAQLAENYATSRTTVQKSVKTLVDEGILFTRHGWGTFVASKP
jgi:hypothetical protein